MRPVKSHANALSLGQSTDIIPRAVPDDEHPGAKQVKPKKARRCAMIDHALFVFRPTSREKSGSYRTSKMSAARGQRVALPRPDALRDEVNGIPWVLRSGALWRDGCGCALKQSNSAHRSHALAP